MCGICVSSVFSFDSESRGPCKNCTLSETSEFSLKRRGPDHFSSEYVHCTTVQVHLDFYASVLHMRGEKIVPQPYKDKCGNILLWNGEIYDGDLYSGDNVSDTSTLFNALSVTHTVEDVLNVISTIKGPYAFIYYQKKEELLWFGRDIFGRRSLLWSLSQDAPLMFLLSSVSLGKQNWLEVPCEGMFCLDLTTSTEKRHVIINKYSWTHTISGLQMTHSKVSCWDNLPFKIILSELQVQSPVKVPLNRDVPYNDILPELLSDEVLQKILQLQDIAQTLMELELVLSQAVERRVRNQNFMCKNCVLNSVSSSTLCCHSSVSILFSGGLDSIVIAALADRYVPNNIPVDLLNVAFECHDKGLKVKRSDELSQSKKGCFDTPDRITGQKGMLELKKLNKARQWNFVEIDVTHAELENERVKTISNLIAPLCTVLDDSIGCAIWFATRGKGTVHSEGERHLYCSPSRVVLVGMGADELFAGYSRHRGKFNIGGWSLLIDEMSVELDRISTRNLGRDDRIISDHGREARFPFLDEDVISFLNGIPMWLKADLRYSRGIGEKLLLRLLAFKLGLKEAALLPKKAIQFGSRIARCENSHEKGSDVCKRLTELNVSLGML